MRLTRLGTLALISAVLALPLESRASSCLSSQRVFARIALTSDHDLQSEPEYLEILRLSKNDPDFVEWMSTQQWGESDSLGLILSKYGNWRANSKSPLEARFRAKQVDLTPSAALEAPHTGLCQLCPWLEAKGRVPREYAARVLELKAGDTVVFEGTKFRLGKFLGRGNAAHVWEVEGRPNEVLKIPFYAGPTKGARGRDFNEMNLLGSWAAKKFAQMFVQMEQKLAGLSIPRATITGHADDYSYVLVKKVSGTENGRAFLTQLSANPSELERKKHLKLLQRVLSYRSFIHRDRYAPGASPAASEQEVEMLARQFLYDGNDWVLVDWEPLL